MTGEIYSPTAEEAVLGALLIDPAAIKTLAILPEEFYIERNQWVFHAINDLHARGDGVDYVTVCSYLDKWGKLAELGGPARITGLLTGGYISSLNIGEYAGIIKDKARRRRMLRIAEELSDGAYHADNLNDVTTAAMDKLSKSVIAEKGAQSLASYLTRIYDEVEKAYSEPRETFGIPTGFPEWDLLTGGLQKSEVVKLSGEPGIGKSILAMQLLANAAKAGHPGVLYELEMGGNQVVRRLVSGQSKITTKAMRSGRMTDDEWTKFVTAIGELEALPVYLCDESQMTSADVRADLYRLKDKFGVELMVLDYEALLCDDIRGVNEWEISNLKSQRIHGIVKDLDIAAVVIDDMNKAGMDEDKKGKTGLAGGARKLHDADQIIIMRQTPESLNTVRLKWDKFREGNRDIFVDLVKLPDYPFFGPKEKRRMP